MMRSAAILAALLGVAAAQNATQIAGLIQFLTAANLTSLAAAAQSVGNTTEGQILLSSLFKGPVTVLAPNNNAFTGVPKNISTNPQLLADVLSYHVIPGTVNGGNFFNNSNTIAKTLLNSSSEVFLGPGNQFQAIGFRLEKDNFTHVLNQNTPVRILNTTTAGNITLNIVDAVVDLPGDVGDALKANKLSLFTAAAAQAGLLDAINTTHGVTIFAPTDAAFTTALANQTSTPNATVLAEILSNHIINGSVLYSSELSGANPISAGGEAFSFATNANGSTVTSGNSTASITVSDIITWNGVIHIIDAVLFNNASDPSAAASAYQSATSSAASAASVAATATAPAAIIGTPAPSGTSGNGSSSGGSGGGKGGALSGKDVSRALALVGLSAVAGLFAL